MTKNQSSAKADPFQVNHELIVRSPAQEEAMPIPLPDWKRLMQRIENCGEKTARYEATGWASIGIATSALLAAITFPLSVKFSNPDGTANLPGIFTEVVCAVGFIGSGILAWWAFDFARQHAVDRAEVRSSILADMRLIEDRHPPKPIAPVQIPKSLEVKMEPPATQS